MLTSLASSHAPRFWLSLIVAASVTTFVAGIATGEGLSRGGQGLVARDATGVRITGTVDTRVSSPGSVHDLSGAQWEALYGPTAATWGVWKPSPHGRSPSTAQTGELP